MKGIIPMRLLKKITTDQSEGLKCGSLDYEGMVNQNGQKKSQEN